MITLSSYSNAVVLTDISMLMYAADEWWLLFCCEWAILIIMNATNMREL